MDIHYSGTRKTKAYGTVRTTCMVTWQTLVRIAFDVSKGKGATFEGIEEGGDFLTQLSEVWESDKAELKQMTERQAENYLDDIVEA